MNLERPPFLLLPIQRQQSLYQDSSTQTRYVGNSVCHKVAALIPSLLLTSLVEEAVRSEGIDSSYVNIEQPTGRKRV